MKRILYKIDDHEYLSKIKLNLFTERLDEETRIKNGIMDGKF